MIGDESTRGLAACAKPSRSRYSKGGCRCVACSALAAAHNALRRPPYQRGAYLKRPKEPLSDISNCGTPSRSRYEGHRCRCRACRECSIEYRDKRRQCRLKPLPPAELAYLRRMVGFTP